MVSVGGIVGQVTGAEVVAVVGEVAAVVGAAVGSVVSAGRLMEETVARNPLEPIEGFVYS